MRPFCLPLARPQDLFLQGFLGRPPAQLDNLFWIVSRPREALSSDQAIAIANDFRDSHQSEFPNVNARVFGSPSGQHIVAFATWIDRADIGRFDRLLNRTALEIERILFSDLRKFMGYSTLNDVPRCAS